MHAKHIAAPAVIPRVAQAMPVSCVLREIAQRAETSIMARMPKSCARREMEKASGV